MERMDSSMKEKATLKPFDNEFLKWTHSLGIAGTMWETFGGMQKDVESKWRQVCLGFDKEGAVMNKIYTKYYPIGGKRSANKFQKIAHRVLAQKDRQAYALFWFLRPEDDAVAMLQSGEFRKEWPSVWQSDA
jgi:hypothetical protein